MKSFLLFAFLFSVLTCFSQSQFDTNSFKQYLANNKDLSKEALFAKHPQLGNYFGSDQGPFDIKTAEFYDSVMLKLQLKPDELKLLKENHFVVTERLSNTSVLGSMEIIYNYDLPVMITTDVLLHALHNSYDNMLKDVEKDFLEQNLSMVLSKMYNQFLVDAPNYNANSILKPIVSDVELFLITAITLLDSTKTITPRYISASELNQIKDAIYAEKMLSIPLFTYSYRPIDFSQFTPRGHYTDGQEEYFRSMIWLSFINLFLTKPAEDDALDAQDIKRMTMVSAMINSLLYSSNADLELNENDEIIKYFVGESDNLTPYEFKNVLGELSIESIAELNNDSVLKVLQETLVSQEEYGQKILSGIIMTDPFSSEPAPLPISYKLFGQRFVIDSYVLHNVSYDRITYNQKKVMRMMPDPLDVMFCLGNNNAIHLLEAEFEKYPYGSAADAMRFLFDAYDEGYWSSSLYNTWLKTIKELSVAETNENTPFFMKTVAWQHEKLNSQLASWSQLRHDNVLYAKQSYTGGVGCSYPHGYVEPYPGFFLTLKLFANDAARFMNNEKFGTDSYEIFWNRFASITDTLLNLVLKEVNGEPFSEEQINFIQQALRVKNYGICGAPPEFDGWLPKLFWKKSDASEADFTVVDVHTQPTDEVGNMVGKVLHTGVGRFNMGVFIAPSPSNKYKPTLYCGPTFSYYQFETENFERKNDKEWEEMLYSKDMKCPNWTNIYLTNTSGTRSEASLRLKGSVFTDSAYTEKSPSPVTKIGKKSISVWQSGNELHIKGIDASTQTIVSVFDVNGREIFKTFTSSTTIPFTSDPNTIYFYRLSSGNKMYSGKVKL